MVVKSFLATIFIFFYIISSTSCLDNCHFKQVHTNPLYYNEIHKEFATKSQMSCVDKCITYNFVKRCTHAVIKNTDHGRVQCTILDATNGADELQIADKYTVWRKGKNIFQLRWGPYNGGNLPKVRSRYCPHEILPWPFKVEI